MQPTNHFAIGTVEQLFSALRIGGDLSFHVISQVLGFAIKCVSIDGIEAFRE
ncbi:MAG: hypothetical protein AAFY14_10235 [Pseudomonadota bacterium]